MVTAPAPGTTSTAGRTGDVSRERGAITYMARNRAAILSPIMIVVRFVFA
jgi:hypothetical protein